MADPRLKALENLALAKEQGEQGVLSQKDVDQNQDSSFFDKLMGYLEVPGRATRAGIGALQDDRGVLDAIRGQIGTPTEKAPSGFDIASKVGEDYGIENPYALTAIATAADVLDPTIAIPGGMPGKLAAAGMIGTRVGPKAAAAAKGMYKVGDISFPARSSAEAMQIAKALKQQSKVSGTTTLVKDDPIQKISGGVQFMDDAIRPATNLDTRKFEGVRNLLKAKSQLK